MVETTQFQLCKIMRVLNLIKFAFIKKHNLSIIDPFPNGLKMNICLNV